MVVGGGADEGHIYLVGLDILVVELVVVFCCCISLGFCQLFHYCYGYLRGGVCEEGIYLPPHLRG